jgi:hypothetical protein
MGQRFYKVFLYIYLRYKYVIKHTETKVRIESTGESRINASHKALCRCPGCNSTCWEEAEKDNRLLPPLAIEFKSDGDGDLNKRESAK